MSPRGSLTTNVLPSRMLTCGGLMCCLYRCRVDLYFRHRSGPLPPVGRGSPEPGQRISLPPRMRTPIRGTRWGDQPEVDVQNPSLRITMVAPPWFDVPPRAYGGIEQMCADLVDELVAHGHDITLLGTG